MTLKTNSFEATGVTPGTTTVNGTNSATSGDALSAFGTVTYSNAQAAHGTLSLLLNNASGSNSAVQWTYSGATSIAARVYFYVTDTPTAATHVLRVGGSAGIPCRVIIGTDRKLAVQDFAGTTLWTASTALFIGSWYRIELACAIGSANNNGTIKSDYYLLDSTSPVEPGYSSVAANTSGGTAGLTIATISAGKYNATTWTSPAYIDDFAANDGTTTYIGAAGIAPPTVNAGADKTGTVGQAISIGPDATATAATGGTLTGYQWVQTAGPPVTINNATSLTGATFTPTVAGGYDFTLTATQTG